MIDELAALAIADEHIAARPAPLDGYRLVRGDPQAIDEGWFFAYCIECNLNIPDTEQIVFGGAPGFIVDRSFGNIRIASKYHQGRTSRST